MLKPIVYLDMDGVLADFVKTSAELFGSEWKTEIEKPSWGKFSLYPNLYELLDPMPGALDLYNGCVELVGGDRNQVQILTALPSRATKEFPDAARHKIEWARKHVHPSIRVHFGPFAKDKQYHYHHPNDILIDDMLININQWTAAGGIGILYLNSTQSLIDLSLCIRTLK